ncbi:N-acetyl-gamma-glutamyl-phosphate reductase [bacterium HR20]|nr:N-acetyl-gamma-glutamyl-phosphate reductase [bacterium HR20]
MTRVGIIGASGYAGTELVRVLAFHPHVEIAYLVSQTHAGKPMSALAPDLDGIVDTPLQAQPTDDADVVFLAVPHGAARAFLAEHPQLARSIIVDLSSDHRSDAAFVYGLPELNRERIRAARRIANPGCFATALSLSLLPLQHSGITLPIYASGITGSTGAGAQLSPTVHFSWRFANVEPYSILSHRHAEEVRTALGLEPPLHFVPQRGPFTRGIVTTTFVPTALPEERLAQLYREYFAAHPLVRYASDPPDLKRVVGTARAVVHCAVRQQTAVIICALDNMLKGAAAQAVQNMNLALGLDETAGLPLRSIGW